MRPLPSIACSSPPSDRVDRGAIATALADVRTSINGDPSRITSTRTDEHETCTLTWSSGASTTLRVRSCFEGYVVHMHDRFVMDRPIRITARAPVRRRRPDDAQEAARWTMGIAEEVLSTFLTGLEWADLEKDGNLPVKMNEIASRVGAVLRFQQGHRSPLSRLVLRSPWEEAGFGEWTECSPLPEDAAFHLDASIPPAFQAEPVHRDGLSYVLSPVAYGIGSFDIEDTMAVLREMATWKRP